MKLKTFDDSQAGLLYLLSPWHEYKDIAQLQIAAKLENCPGRFLDIVAHRQLCLDFLFEGVGFVA
jgi:hypothetical protein